MWLSVSGSARIAPVFPVKDSVEDRLYAGIDPSSLKSAPPVPFNENSQ